MLNGFTRAEVEAYRGEASDGRLQAYSVARKQEAAPSPWEVDMGRFVQKAAHSRGLEKLGETAGFLHYGDHLTGTHMFVNKADGKFFYTSPRIGEPKEGHVSAFDPSYKADPLKPKNADPASDGSTDAASGNDHAAEARRRYHPTAKSAPRVDPNPAGATPDDPDDDALALHAGKK